VKAVMNLRVPQNAGKLLSGCTTGGLSSIHGTVQITFTIMFYVLI
jgi:hypothetical protein